MFKAATLLFLHAETGVHAGSGQSLGAIDLAIQRERYTGYPMIAASGVKGALRDWFSRKYEPQENAEGKKKPAPQVAAAFGPDTDDASDHAGAVATTDARVLLFPVRSARGVFAWTTSPTALARLKRDLKLTPWTDDPPEAPHFDDDETVVGSPDCAVKDAQGVLLEEYHFTFQSSDAVSTLAEWLVRCALPEGDEYQFWRDHLAARLLILPDNVFRDFVEHATEVQARVKLKTDTKTVAKGALFYQENLPADTLLYAAVLATDDLSGWRRDGAEMKAADLLDLLRELDGERIQLGGDETIGKGICCVRFLPATPTA